jgi:pyruvate,orthophosphate dikinase
MTKKFKKEQKAAKKALKQAKKAVKKASKGQWVYFFGMKSGAEGAGLPKDILGGKGQGLAEMIKIGLPVPAGFTITIDACAKYYELGKKFPSGFEDEVLKNVKKLEKETGKKLGDDKDPLLVSVRSGAARSMPGM